MIRDWLARALADAVLSDSPTRRALIVVAVYVAASAAVVAGLIAVLTLLAGCRPLDVPAPTAPADTVSVPRPEVTR